jgi:hypothetical protein
LRELKSVTPTIVVNLYIHLNRDTWIPSRMQRSKLRDPPALTNSPLEAAFRIRNVAQKSQRI